MATAQQLLDVARSKIGYKENPAGSNRTEFGKWYGMDGQPWCAMFVSWCLHSVGMTDLKFAYTPSGANWFKQRGQWHTSNPQPGDIVFFDFPDRVYRIQHVGIVESVIPGGVVTIEGNTSGGVAGSQSNGDGVYRRTRKSSIVGYGRPVFTGAVAAPAPTPAPVPAHVHKTGWMNGNHGLCRKGMNDNPTVGHMQALAGGLTVDGDFGPASERRLRALQAHWRIAVDGVCGDQSWARLHPMVRQGDKSFTTQEVQHSLGGLAIDGDFGPATHNAVCQFQRQNGLGVDGIVGPATWRALLA